MSTTDSCRAESPPDPTKTMRSRRSPSELYLSDLGSVLRLIQVKQKATVDHVYTQGSITQGNSADFAPFTEYTTSRNFSCMRKYVFYCISNCI